MLNIIIIIAGRLGKNLYTTTNKCLQRIIKIMYSVF